MPKTMSMSDAAREIFVLYRHDLERRRRPGVGDLAEIRDWAGKADGHTVRVATLLQLMWNAIEETEVYPNNVPPPPDTLSPEAMAHAVVLMDYFAEHAKAAYGKMGNTDAAVRERRMWHLRAWLRDRGERFVSLRDVKQAMRNTAMFKSHDHDLVRDTLDDMARLDWLRVVVPPDSKQRFYLTNPGIMR